MQAGLALQRVVGEQKQRTAHQSAQVVRIRITAEIQRINLLAQAAAAKTIAMGNADASTIGESDTRAMIRLLAGLAVGDDSLAGKRALLMGGLCQIIGADRWVWTLIGRKEAGEMLTFSVQAHGGFGEQQFTRYLEAQEHPDMKEYNAPFLAEYAANGTHLTRLRQQIDVEGRFPQSDAYALWREADIAPLIMSFRPTIGGQTSCIGIFRGFERELFSPRESRIAHILLSEVAWLHEENLAHRPERAVYNISPRLNTVLNLLLQGRGRKQIASELGISINTVNGYAKDLYRRFDVHSQSELIRRFVDGDGGDTP